MSILDHRLITERYFFPRADELSSPTQVQVDGATLNCFSSGISHAKTVLFFHGNGEVAADYGSDHATWCASFGCDLFIGEYRGYGGSTGVPQLGKMLDDVTAIVESVGRPRDEIVVFGRSVGSIYAIEAVHQFPDLAGLILESGIADVGERISLRASPAELGATDEEVNDALQRVDHQGKLNGYSGATLILHAGDDDLVSVDHAHQNAEWASGDVTKIVFDQGGHNAIFYYNRDAYTEAVQRFVQEI